MKKKLFLSLIITMMMTMVTSPAFAASGTNYEVEVGKTLRLDISNFGVECMANGSSHTWEITQVNEGEFYDAFHVRVVNSKAPSTGPATLEVFPTPQTMKVGETKWVYAKQTRAIGGTYFYSENESIATVTHGELASAGSYTTAAEITAKKTGKVNIVAKNVNGLTAVCEVTVTSQPVSSVNIQSSLSLEVGGTYKLTPTVYPSDAETTYTWTSDNNTVATVSSNGKVSAKSAGTANITVKTDNGKTATCKITINSPQTTDYEVSYHVYDNGKMTYNGTELTGYDSFKVAEGSDVALTIVPDEGYKIDWLWIDYEDVKDQLAGNVLSIRNVKKNIYVLVSFEKVEQVPDTPNEPVVTTENALTLGDVTAYIGTSVAFPISLTNEDEITALQMDLHLPTGIALATDEEGDVKIETSSRVSNKHTVDCNKMADGSYRIICYSTKNNIFTGNCGELFSLSLIVGSELNDGDYEITATNIELSDKTGTAYPGQDVKGVITVKSYMPGDVDGNGQHSINDVVSIINYVLNRPNTTFIEAAADLDGNGEISVNDAVSLISKYILGTSSTARKATRATVVNNEENYMHIENVTMQPGEVRIIEVMMTNEREDIKGLQCDITLPQGVSFLYDEDAEDYVSASSRVPRKLILSSDMQGENTLRVAGVCTGSSSIYGNSGSVFSFKVKADENIMPGIYEIQLTNIELSYGEAIDVADRSSALEILNNVSDITALTTDRCFKSGSYDLNGRRVDASKAKKGIFIVNGKKVLIK